MKFLYSVTPTQSDDDIFISTRSLFRKLFTFYTLIISYIPKRGHHHVIIIIIIIMVFVKFQRLLL